MKSPNMVDRRKSFNMGFLLRPSGNNKSVKVIFIIAVDLFLLSVWHKSWIYLLLACHLEAEKSHVLNLPLVEPSEQKFAQVSKTKFQRVSTKVLQVMTRLSFFEISH